MVLFTRLFYQLSRSLELPHQRQNQEGCWSHWLSLSRVVLWRIRKHFHDGQARARTLLWPITHRPSLLKYWLNVCIVRVDNIRRVDEDRVTCVVTWCASDPGSWVRGLKPRLWCDGFGMVTWSSRDLVRAGCEVECNRYCTRNASVP